MIIHGQVTDPDNTAFPVGAQPAIALGRTGGPIVETAFGAHGAAGRSGNVFVMSTVIAGVALPVNAATLVSKFTLWNPAGSGKVAELIEFTHGIDSATEVVNGLALGFQTSVSTNGGPPTSLTATVNGPASTYLGGGEAPMCKGYTAATMTNAAVLPIYPLGLNMDATAVGQSGNGSYHFNGKIWVPPDTVITFCTTVAAATAMPLGLTWAEW